MTDKRRPLATLVLLKNTRIESEGTIVLISKAYHDTLWPHNDRGTPFQEAIYTYSHMQAPRRLQSNYNATATISQTRQ